MEDDPRGWRLVIEVGLSGAGELAGEGQLDLVGQEGFLRFPIDEHRRGGRRA